MLTVNNSLKSFYMPMDTIQTLSRIIIANNSITNGHVRPEITFMKRRRRRTTIRIKIAEDAPKLKNHVGNSFSYPLHII